MRALPHITRDLGSPVDTHSASYDYQQHGILHLVSVLPESSLPQACEIIRHSPPEGMHLANPHLQQLLRHEILPHIRTLLQSLGHQENEVIATVPLRSVHHKPLSVDTLVKEDSWHFGSSEGVVCFVSLSDAETEFRKLPCVRRKATRGKTKFTCIVSVGPGDIVLAPIGAEVVRVTPFSETVALGVLVAYLLKSQ